MPSQWFLCNSGGATVSWHGFALWVEDYNTTIGNQDTLELSLIAKVQFNGIK
jgi:hypothetical protein